MNQALLTHAWGESVLKPYSVSWKFFVVKDMSPKTAEKRPKLELLRINCMAGLLPKKLIYFK